MDRRALYNLAISSPFLLALGCAMPTPDGYANEIVAAPSNDGRLFGAPERAVNGVRGGGEAQGSLDVLSLHYGEELVLGWSGGRVINTPGTDFVVFENPFVFGNDRTFMDPIVVEVSLDGTTWVPLPHDYRAADETRYSTERADWQGFAGIEPVRVNVDDNPIDERDVAAGGDRFDLDALDVTGTAGEIRAVGFRFLRLSAAFDHINPDTGAPFVRDPLSDGPDIDGVWANEVVTP